MRNISDGVLLQSLKLNATIIPFSYHIIQGKYFLRIFFELDRVKAANRPIVQLESKR